ncbi:MAG: hypothetical protein JO181_15670, partial [Solirubrobacterales bacterium]|nr:hypothetical protein [Solirubrobacterales bacterium]
RCHFYERAHTLPRATGSPPVPRESPREAPVLEAHGVRKTFHQEGHAIQALADVEFALKEGETLGLVG